jgi:riboflavin synthase
MFTGIVEAKARVTRVEDVPGLRRLWMALPDIAGLTRGGSVAVDGVCLTAVEISPEAVRFDVIAETLRLTTLGALQVGSWANVERAATVGKEIGGHMVSGHVSGVAAVVAREDGENNVRIEVQLPQSLVPFVLRKGFVAIHGVSLTVGAVDEVRGVFDVHLIPETLDVTVLGDAEVGTRLNIEIDAMTQAVVETVRRVLARQSGLAE